MKMDGAELRDPKAKLRIRFRDQERLVLICEDYLWECA